MFMFSNFTLVAHPFATSEGTLYPSYSSFFRTYVPSSQYKGRMERSYHQEQSGELKEVVSF